MYLWVLERNSAARLFYGPLGGTGVERAPVPPPGGVPAPLHGAPDMLRVAWSGTSFPARRTGR